MGKVNRKEVIGILLDENPLGKRADVEIYCDAFIEYTEAQANIREHGTIVFHPRTGQPIENPYIKIRANSFTVMQKLGDVHSDDLWEYYAEVDAE